MYNIAILVLAVASAIAAVVAVLPSLGFDLRIIGRPKIPLEGIPSFRARQAWIALAIAIVSLVVSVGAFYYFFHPRNVDRIVEKMVPSPCPEQKSPEVTSIPGAKPLRRGGRVEAKPITGPKAGPVEPPTQNCPNGICVGGELSGTATVNNYEGHKPLIMSADQAVLVAANLGSFRGQTVDVDVVDASEETDKFANVLIAALSSAGLRVARNEMGQMVGGCLHYPGITFMAGVNRLPLVGTIWGSLVQARVVEERSDHKIPGCSRSGEPDELHIEIFRP
jgi:hypothetical protein